MNFFIFGTKVVITVVDFSTHRFVIDVQKNIGELTLGVTIQVNKNDETKISVNAELYKGIPF